MYRLTMAETRNIYNRKLKSSFICAHCGRRVPLSAGGTHYRNHCPFCLWSLHVDSSTGDRKSDCMSIMEPIGIWAKPGGEWAIIHRCCTCGFIRSNRIAGDDREGILLSLALKPIMIPPFPVGRVLEEMAWAGNSGGVQYEY